MTLQGLKRKINLQNFKIPYFAKLYETKNKIEKIIDFDKFLKKLFYSLNEKLVNFDGEKLINFETVKIDTPKNITLINQDSELHSIYSNLIIFEVQIGITTELDLINKRKVKETFLNNIFLIKPSILMVQGSHEGASYIENLLDLFLPNIHFSTDGIQFTPEFLIWMLSHCEGNRGQILPFHIEKCSEIMIRHTNHKQFPHEMWIRTENSNSDNPVLAMAFLLEYLPRSLRMEVKTLCNYKLELLIHVNGRIQVFLTSGYLRKKYKKEIERIILGCSVVLLIINNFENWILKNNTSSKAPSQITHPNFLLEKAMEFIFPAANLLNEYFGGYFEPTSDKTIKVSDLPKDLYSL